VPEEIKKDPCKPYEPFRIQNAVTMLDVGPEDPRGIKKKVAHLLLVFDTALWSISISLPVFAKTELVG
jgi:hypothetical protein